MCLLHMAALAAAFCFPSCGERAQDAVEVASEIEAMGTVVSITAYAPSESEGQAATGLAEEEIRRLEKLWSATDPESEISELNRSSAPVTVSDETARLLGFSKEMSERTGGAFDPTVLPLVNAWGFLTHQYRVPPDGEIAGILSRIGSDKLVVAGNTAMLLDGAQLDLGGIAKGAAGDIVAKALKDSGIKSAIINLGGNVHLVGARTDGSPWKIGIRDPYGKGILGIVAVQDCAVVTSGIYERNFTDSSGHLYHHIMDSATGRPAESGLISVTIISHGGMLADALSTGLFVMGPEKSAAFWRECGESLNGGFEIVLVTVEGTVLVSEGIAEVFMTEASDVQVITRNGECERPLPDYIRADAIE